MKQIHPGFLRIPSPLQSIQFPGKKLEFSRISIKRDDLIHPFISGNKWRKLAYNIREARKEGKDGIVSPGGPYSNHLVALAAAGHKLGMRTIGLVRGQSSYAQNPSLRFASAQGMQLHFLDRERYRQRNKEDFQSWVGNNFPNTFYVPEGGSNMLAFPGLKELGEEILANNYCPDILVCAVGSGGTLAGLRAALPEKIEIIGIAAVKDYSLEYNINNLLPIHFDNWSLDFDYCFGGFGKVNEQLLRFIMEFYKEHAIVLDPVYTAKAMYGLIQRLQSDISWRDKEILFYHSGGLQGIAGLNDRYKKVQLDLPSPLDEFLDS